MIGERISMLRRIKGLSQREFARLIEVSPQTVSAWESNTQRPSKLRYQSIAEALGVTVAELLEEDLQKRVQQVKPHPMPSQDANLEAVLKFRREQPALFALLENPNLTDDMARVIASLPKNEVTA